MAVKRRGRGEDSVYFDQANGYWVGSVSLGFSADGKRRRRTVRGRTKTEVRDKHRHVLKPVLEHVGHAALRDLTAHDVRHALTVLGKDRSSATVAIAHNALTRAIRHAEGRDLVRRNVAALVDSPKGQAGRPSQALTLDQAQKLLTTAGDLKKYRLGAYVSLCLLTGMRTEEARALTWEHVDLDGQPDASPPVPPSMAVWRSVREHGDTKTRKSRRTLALPQASADALRAHLEMQAADRLTAGGAWQDQGLVFCTRAGTPLDAANIRRQFRDITDAAGLGRGWTPQELTHVRVPAIGQRNARRGDRQARRALQHANHRGDLPAGASASTNTRRRGDGRHLRLARTTGSSGRPARLRRSDRAGRHGSCVIRCCR